MLATKVVIWVIKYLLCRSILKGAAIQQSISNKEIHD